MKTLILLRGLPGGGKSTYAKNIVSDIDATNAKYHDATLRRTIRSTDDQFMVNGVYTFNPRLLGVNHAKNQQLVEQDMKDGVDFIIVDNTNIKRNDFKFYVDAAKRHGYQVQEQVIGRFDEDFIKICSERNTHGVPIESIRRMAQNFQA